ncbi:MAG TPA: hypothetical protein VII73_13645 [Caulobacteraceae bacterium]
MRRLRDLTMNVPHLKRRLAIAMAINVVCAIVALAAIAAAFAFHVGALIWLIGAAVIVGFGAQGWLILGLIGRRSSS